MISNLLQINKKTISTPIIDIVKQIQLEVTNGKLNTIRDRGNNIRVTCPFHKGGHEHKASADIYIGEEVEKIPLGWFKCFTCGEQGPFEHFVAGVMDCSEVEAKHWLIENFADGEIEDQGLYLPPLITSKSKSQKISESILDTFESYHPYMFQRKLSKRIIEVFDVKYDPNTRCIVFPVRDEHGDIVMLTRRSVLNKTFIIDENKEKPLYLLYYMMQNNIENVMITEGQIDALTACTYGFPCIATMGAISDHQIDLINRSGIRVLYIMFDNDDSGKKFRHKLLTSLNKDILTVSVNILQNGKKDINDLTEEEFYSCINYAETHNFK